MSASAVDATVHASGSLAQTSALESTTENALRETQRVQPGWRAARGALLYHLGPHAPFHPPPTTAGEAAAQVAATAASAAVAAAAVAAAAVAAAAAAAAAVGRAAATDAASRLRTLTLAEG
jgi:hypothetical protein